MVFILLRVEFNNLNLNIFHIVVGTICLDLRTTLRVHKITGAQTSSFENHKKR